MLLCVFLSASVRAGGQTMPAAAGADLFETRIRPLLATKCFGCHGATAKPPSAGLRLDDPAAFRGALGGRLVVPGKPLESRLFAVLDGSAGKAAMPPSGPLPKAEQDAVKRWIAIGAPVSTKRGVSTGIHWAFQPLRSPKLPAVRQTAWVRNPIDRFILAKLETKGLQPSPEADRRTLLKRVTYDLTGMPPTIHEVEQFLRDRRADAYERVVDRLLASPRYGERWARHWLDVVHYADTHGYDKDKKRPNAWPYRDWVVRALNTDMPWSRFVQQQVAGDALSPGEPDGVIATGFLAAGPWDFVGNVELGETTLEKAKTRYLDRDDIVSTVMGAFNSVTVHCARCHDHKFDPITQRSYYSLQAVFAGVERGDRLVAETEGGGSTPSPSNGWHSGIEAKQDVVKWVQVDLGSSMPVSVVRLIPARPTDFADTPGFGFPVRYKLEIADNPEMKNALAVADYTAADVPNPGAKPVEIDTKGSLARYIRITATRLWPRTNDFVFALAEVQVISGGKNVARAAAVTSLDSIEAGRWSRRFLTDGFDSRTGSGRMVYAAVPRAPRPVHLLVRGEVEQPSEEMAPGALACLPGLPPELGSTTTPDTARRANLAAWLTRKENVLTWRSVVNRVWQHHFGQGIVDTPNDFGRNGSRPTHPELLDWLAVHFRDSGNMAQSLKQLHRLMVLSSTYRQSSLYNPRAIRIDSGNQLLWRMSRRRLDAEEIRDSVLAASGSLDETMGGPGYEPFRFKDDHSPVYDHTDTEAQLKPANWRRTLYRFTVRSVPDPFLDVLDAADPNVSVPVRNATLTALQSLTLWNSPFMLHHSELLAAKVPKSGAGERVRWLFRRLFQREPAKQELSKTLLRLADDNLNLLCRVLLNSNEFLFAE
jgi:cytochrome c553